VTKAKDGKEIGEPQPKYGRGKNPNSLKNLEKGMAKPGDVLNPTGKPLGTKDRSTILNKWLSVELELLNPVTKAKERGTVEDEVILALITKARKGDVSAVREILDSTYGKLTEKLQVNNYDFSKLTNEEIIEFDRLLTKLNS
jgi:hypothetical protein